MMDRRKAEFKMVEEQFGQITVSPDLDWFIVEEFPLPPGRYNRSSTRLLHFLGPGYPPTPPDNFLVPSGLRTNTGQPIGEGYSEGANHLGEEWGTFSWHAKDWKPGVEVLDGDNLLTFLGSVYQRLKG